MKKYRISVLCVFTLGAIIASLLTGRFSLSVGDILRVVSGTAETLERAVFLKVRLPRTLMTVFAGIALSISGWTFQNIFMNTLASPDVLGVSSGCAVGAIAAILAGYSASIIAFCSLFAGLATVAITLLLARAVGRERNVTMLLSGIVVGALANSVIMLLKYIADPNGQLAAIEYWLMGSFHSADWTQLSVMLPIVLPCCALTLLLSHPIRLLALGDDEAASLGIPVQPVKYIALAASTAMVAGVVSLCGSISWLGLIVPHACRILAGERRSTPFEVCIAGAGLMTIADLLARSLTSSEIPVSILTSFMGALFLMILLMLRSRRIRRNYEHN